MHIRYLSAAQSGKLFSLHAMFDELALDNLSSTHWTFQFYYCCSWVMKQTMGRTFVRNKLLKLLLRS